MDDIVAAREWITHKMEARGARIEVNCNMTMREILDVIEWPYTSNFVLDMFYAILPGRDDLAIGLYLDIENSLVRNFIPVVWINLSFTYVGLILGGWEPAQPCLSGLQVMGLSFSWRQKKKTNATVFSHPVSKAWDSWHPMLWIFHLEINTKSNTPEPAKALFQWVSKTQKTTALCLVTVNM